MNQAARQYIADRCIPVPFAGCWLWLLSTGSHGYGNASTTGARVVLAHRLSFETFKGPIPPGAVVQHSCDERLCVNPDHLSLGTHKTNADDKIRKGRGGYESLRGRRMPHRKPITPGQVAAIRCVEEPHVVTARRTGIHWKTISRIRLGQSHNHIHDVKPDPLPLLPEELAELEELDAARDAMADEWGQTDDTTAPRAAQGDER